MILPCTENDLLVHTWQVPHRHYARELLAKMATMCYQYDLNPLATRTTLRCPNRCTFCAVPKIEGDFHELSHWPDLPIVCDSNLLGASDIITIHTPTHPETSNMIGPDAFQTMRDSVYHVLNPEVFRHKRFLEWKKP